MLRYLKNSTNIAALLCATTPRGDRPGARIERTEDVALEGLARSEHHRLVGPLDVGGANLRVEVQVGFILIEDLLARGP